MSKQEGMSQDQIKNLLIIINMRFYARIMQRHDEKWWRNQSWLWQYHLNSWWIAWKLLQIKAKQWDGQFWWFFFVHNHNVRKQSVKNIYQRSEFRDWNQHWKWKLCSKSQQMWKKQKNTNLEVRNQWNQAKQFTKPLSMMQ